MKEKIIALCFIILGLLFIGSSGGLYLYLDGSFWPLTQDIAKGNFINEFRSFIVTNANSGYDKNLFTGTRIFTSGYIYLLVSIFGVLGGKIVYLMTVFLLIIHSCYLICSIFFTKDKYKSILFGTFIACSGIFLNNTNQVYLLTIPGIFYSLYFTLIYIKTGKWYYIIFLVLSQYMLLGYIRYTMMYYVFLGGIIFSLYQDVKPLISIKKAIYICIANLIAFSVFISSYIYLKTSQIPSATNSYSEYFAQYYPRASYDEFLNFFYALNLEKNINISYILGIIIGVIVMLYPLYFLSQKKKTGKIRLAFIGLACLIVTLSIFHFQELYFILVKIIPFIRNQPLFLVYFGIFFGSLLLFSTLPKKHLTILVAITILGFGHYWHSFHYFPIEKLEQTLKYTEDINPKNAYNNINTPTLYLPTTLLDYGEYKSLNLHNFMSFPSIGIDNSRLYFGKTFAYNRNVKYGDTLYLNSLKKNSNLKLIKISKHNYKDGNLQKLYTDNKDSLATYIDSGDVSYIGEDDFYYYYQPQNTDNEDYFIHSTDESGFKDIQIFTNKNVDDTYVIKIQDTGIHTIQLLTSFSHNWKIQKLTVSDIMNEIHPSECSNFSKTKNTYCLTQHNIESLVSPSKEGFYTHNETASGRNSFVLNNQIGDSYYLLYYKSHPIKKLRLFFMNHLQKTHE